MKKNIWTLSKLAVIAAFTVAAVLHRSDSQTDAHGLGIGVAVGTAILAIFQLLVWMLYDILTLKRGGWVTPSFSKSPFATRQGPGLYLGTFGAALLVMGGAKLFSAFFQGAPSLILGGWLCGIGLFVLAWQAVLKTLFKRRFEP